MKQSLAKLKSNQDMSYIQVCNLLRHVTILEHAVITKVSLGECNLRNLLINAELLFEQKTL